MLHPRALDPIDYLAIGHLTMDLQSGQPVAATALGGSVAYAGLTARALGLRPGILTAWADELPLDRLEDIPVVNVGAAESTVFENTYSHKGRVQHIHQIAPTLDYHMIPESWRAAPIVHLAPVAGEVPARMLPYLDSSLVVATPQGWLRQRDDAGRVSPGEWPEADHVLRQVDAAVLSMEDVDEEQARIELMAQACPILVVTLAGQGAQLYQGGELEIIDPPQVNEVDPTGAGDIFAAAFFTRLHFGDEAVEAARFATQVAAHSVERVGLESIPTPDELYDFMAGAR